MRSKSQKRTVWLTVWIGTGLLITSYMNACAKMNFSGPGMESLKSVLGVDLILINKDARFTNSDVVELNLDSQAGDEVFISNDAGCANGSWQPMVNTRPWTLADKNRDVTVHAKFRNQSDKYESACLNDAITHDDIAPLIVLENPSLLTNVNVPIFRFVASDLGSGVNASFCEWPGQAAAPCANASENGNIAEGRHLVKVSATDVAGNASIPVTQDLLVDRTKPVVTVLSGPPALGSNTGVSIRFEASDALSGVTGQECSWDGTGYMNCTSPVAATKAEGAHKFFIRATDKAGNVSDVKTHEFVIDQTAPTVVITSSPPDTSGSAQARFEFNGMDGSTPLTIFECSLNGAAFASCSSPHTYPSLADGLQHFAVRGRDASGNLSAPATRGWRIDTQAPTLNFIQTPAALTKLTDADYRYTAADSGSGVAKVQCALDGAAYADCSADRAAYLGLAEGSHTLKVKAIDKAGNAREISHTYAVDLKAPTVTLTRAPAAVSKDASFSFGFTANDANGIERMECRLDAQAFAACHSLTQHAAGPIAEGSRRFGVRAVDKAGNVSDEAVHLWTADLTGPVITYYQMPAAAGLFGSTVTLGFRLEDSPAGVEKVTCTLNGAARACAADAIQSFANLAEGDYSYVVTALDKVGNSSTDTKSWKINPKVLKTQQADVKPGKLDVLVVVDNSGSMAQEQANMGARFANFLQQIRGLDWQIGFVTTDVANDADRKDGRLLPLTGLSSQYILKSSMEITQAQTTFSNTIQMPTNGSGNEQGLKASMRAIQRAFETANPAVNNRNKELFRGDAALAILVVSDAADTSGTTPEQVIQLVHDKWSGQKPFSFHSVVIPESVYTKPSGALNPADPCFSYRESVSQDGRLYHRLSDLTGGVRGTACTNDYGSQLSAMGRVSAELVNSLTLTCSPVDANGDGLIAADDVNVRDAAGTAITDFTLAGNKITFTGYLPVGMNNLEYYCAE